MKNVRTCIDAFSYQAEVCETAYGYNKGETIEDHKIRFVHKAGYQNGFEMVRTIENVKDNHDPQKGN